MPTTHKEHTRYLLFFAQKRLRIAPFKFEYNSSNTQIESDLKSKESFFIGRRDSCDGIKRIRQTLTVTTNIEECDRSDLGYFVEATKRHFSFENLRESINEMQQCHQIQYDFSTTILIDSQPSLYIRVRGSAGKEDYARIVNQYIDDIYTLFHDKYSEQLSPVVVKKSRDIAWAPGYYSHARRTLSGQLQQLTNELKALSLSAECPKETKERLKQILSIKDEVERNASIKNFVDNSAPPLRILLEKHLQLLLQNAELALNAAQQMLDEHPEPPKSCCAVM